MQLDMKELVGKLNPTCRKALEGAVQSCVSQTHFTVEIEHLLAHLLEMGDTDMRQILRYFEVEAAKVHREVTASMAGFKRGNTKTPSLAEQLVTLLQVSWMVSSLQLKATQTRSGAVLMALYEPDTKAIGLLEACPSLLKIPADKLRKDLRELIRGTSEDDKPGKRPMGIAAPAEAEGAAVPPGQARPKPGGALDQYTIDLTEEARSGKIDPILGRDPEIRQVIDILMRRRQNNPILTGEAGVGKTAVVEGFALRVAQGEVPAPLKDIAICTLDLGLLQAGAGVKGEFENRLKEVIAEVKASPRPIILFIDEAHTMIGAGGQAGQNDAANLLKPALARGELRTIAATTWAEYKKYFEKDPALARRFQVIKVEEPDERAAELMLRGITQKLEAHHKVRILDEGVTAAVGLSNRYITGRLLPDKAISVLDTACARVAVAQAAQPAELEAAIASCRAITDEIAILERERTAGREHVERIAELKSELAAAEAERDRLTARWEDEGRRVTEILEIAQRVAKDPKAPESQDHRDLKRLQDDLRAIQKGEPMVPVWVDESVIAAVISGWTGIPVGKMVRDEVAAVLDLEARMGERLVGQPQALTAVARRIKTYHADLDEPNKPVGVFLLVGPSGVGKTETALTLADLLYGGERNLVTINMSEYQEAHSVSGLKGSPPGYVGYGTGGVLTEAVRRNPYSVLLLDEVEKAHPDVMDLFYQVFDKGVLEDGEGVEVSFKNTLILLTSNLGTDVIMAACRDGTQPDPDELAEAIRPALLQRFKPAFLGRLVTVPYYPLPDAIIKRIVRLKLDKIVKRIAENHRAVMTYDDAIVELVAARCTEVDSGARNVDHILTNGLLPRLSTEILGRMADGEAFDKLHVAADESDFTIGFG